MSISKKVNEALAHLNEIDDVIEELKEIVETKQYLTPYNGSNAGKHEAFASMRESLNEAEKLSGKLREELDGVEHTYRYEL